MQQIDTLIMAKWVITVNAQHEVLTDHAVAIHNGRILDILPAAEALTQYEPLESFSLTEHALIPGLINMHGHAAMALFRGMADDLPLMTWLNDHIWPAEATFVGPEFIQDGTRLAIAEMIRCGTTTFSDNFFYPEEAAKVVKESGMRAQLCFPVIDFPTPWAGTADEHIEKGMALHAAYAGDSHIDVIFGPHAPYTVSDEPLLKLKSLASAHGMKIQMHVHETQGEVTEGIDKFGKRPIKRLFDLGLLGPDMQCVHMTALNDEDMDQIQETGTHIMHCPESNLKLASGFCPIDELQKRHINVALGTDGAASNNDLDMIGEMRTAAMLAKAVSGNAEALPAHKALEMATLNGARAMGKADDLGSLETGKLADIAAVYMGDIESAPIFDPVSHLVYATSRNQVTDVWVGGKGLMHARNLTTLSTTAVLKATQAWQRKIQS